MNEDEALTPRHAASSRASLAILVGPHQANIHGHLHGGVLLRLADECGAIAAIRHVGRGEITTAAMDSMVFLNPVFVGERVELTSEVTQAGRTWVEARIDIIAEPIEKAEPRKVAIGHALYVSLDEDRKPIPVPPLISETEADHRRDKAARERQAIRLKRREEARAEG